MLDLNDVNKTRELISLVATFDDSSFDTEGNYLSPEESLDLLINKSDCYFTSALSDKGDLNLRLVISSSVRFLYK